MPLLAFNKKTARRTAAALVERALQGTVTFLATILLGRWAGAAELGLYSLVFSLICVAIALQESLITAPYTVYALEHADGTPRRRYLGAVLAHSNILAALLGVLFGVAALVLFNAGDGASAWATAALVLVVPGVLLREFARRVVYAEIKPEDAVAISGVTGLLQLAMMVALQAAGRLTATSALIALGVSSLLGGGAWLYRRRASFQFRGAPIREPFRQNWQIGKWSFATQVGEIVRTQMFPWLLAIIADKPTVGVFAACAAIAALPTPIHVAVSNLLIPQLVHAERTGGVAAAHRLMWQATGWLTAVMVAFCAAIALLGNWTLRFCYGAEFTATPGTAHALFILALSQLLNGASLPSARALFALRGADKAFASQMIGIVANLALGLPMVSRWGIVGAAYAALIGSALKAGLGAWWYATNIAAESAVVVMSGGDNASEPTDPALAPHVALARTAPLAAPPSRGGGAMNILLVHAYYTQRGGEDQSFEEERDLLRSRGHDVFEYTRQNEELNSASALRAAATTLWNRSASADIEALVKRRRVDVVHLTNTFPLISPAACRAAHRGGAAVVQALRNYRLLCAGAYLLRDGRPCEDCLGKALPLAAIRHGCYRDSRTASAAVATMQVLHRTLGTWRRSVDAFFTLTEFAREKFLAAGFPAGKVHVKHNSVSAAVEPRLAVDPAAEPYAVFAGRLSPEKGIETLLAAWQRDARLPRLVIAGEGPLAATVQAAAAVDPRISWRGALPQGEVLALFRDARVLVMPSLWYETFGRTIAEAFACGTPVAASRLGAMAELVDEGQTGWHFTPGEPFALANAVLQAVRQTSDEETAMRRSARAAYEARFTPEQNYQRLLDIYQLALLERKRRTAHVHTYSPLTYPPLTTHSSSQ